MNDFFRQITYKKKDRATAISATARKLKVLIWNMLAKGGPYQPPTGYLDIDQKRKMKSISRIKNYFAKFDLKHRKIGFEILLNTHTKF